MALTVLALAGAIATGLVIQRSNADAASAEVRLRGIREEKEHLEQEQLRLKTAIDQASDPRDVEGLRQQLAEAQRQLRAIPASNARTVPGHAPERVGDVPPPVRAPGTGKATDACLKGDPLCPTIP